MENTILQVDRKTRALNLASNHCDELFQDYVVAMAAAGNALPVETDTATNVVTTPKTVLYATNIGTQTLLAPKSAATGLEIGGDQTSWDGFEINLQNPGNTDAKFLFTAWSEPVGFYIEAQFSVADVSWVWELLIGFKKNETVAAARSTYTDYACIGLVWAKIETATDLNNAWETLVDSTQTVADAGIVTLRVEVDSDRKVHFTCANSATASMASPTVSQEFTFDSSDVLVPFIRFLHTTDVAWSVIMRYLKCWYLN